MKLRITSVTTPQVGAVMNKYTTTLEDYLRPYFIGKEYGDGIDQFTICFISVNSDPSDNMQYCRPHNKSGKYKDTLTGKMRKYIGIAVPINPEHVLCLNSSDLQEVLSHALLKQLEVPPYQLPKNFDQQKFRSDLQLAFAGC